MSNVVTASEAIFNQVVSSGGLPVFVDFWAPWCGPCRMVSPVVEQLAEEFEGEVQFLKVNVDEEPSLSSKFGVMSIPTLLMIEKGKVVMKVVGAKPVNALRTDIRNALTK